LWRKRYNLRGAGFGALQEAATQDGYVADEGEHESEDENELEEDEVQQPAHGHPRQYNRNARPPPRPVRDDEYVAKLKLNILPFEGRYNPDAYLTWELEVEQHFACLRYLEHLRVSAATCEFIDFASIWWSKHCRVNHANIPATWLGLKHAMRTRFVPPHYQRDLLKKLAHLEQGKNSVQEYYQELQTGMIRCGIVEDNEVMLARFFGDLNKEIQHILDYKEYNTITRLFHLLAKLNLKCRIVNHHGEELIILQVILLHGLRTNQLHLLVGMHQALPLPGIPRPHQERHLFLLHHHLLVRHGVRLPWPPRGRLATFNVINVLGLVTSKKNVEPNM
jgi:hypothetical protein